MCKMNKKDEELLYKASNFTGGCLEIRLFYVRIAPCLVEGVPDHLTLRHLRREIGVTLEINGCRLPSSDSAMIFLRCDRINKESNEVTYVSTDNVRVSGAMEFEVMEDDMLVLCGSLERVDDTWSNGDIGWNMECYLGGKIVNVGKGGGMGLFQKRFGVGSPSIEVYIAGCCSGVPVILTKVIEVSPRRKVPRQLLLDAIPEDEEVGKKENTEMNGLVRHRKLQISDVDDHDAEVDGDTDDSEGKIDYSYYQDQMYVGEDGEMTYFNAGVRVGVGIGLGMCLGVGLGVGLLMRSYQATTRSFRRRFF